MIVTKFGRNLIQRFGVETIVRRKKKKKKKKKKLETCALEKGTS